MSDDLVTMRRDDAFWLMTSVDGPDFEDRERVLRIEREIAVQPIRSGRPDADPLRADAYAVFVEHGGTPLLLTPDLLLARTVARAYNLADGDRRADVYGYIVGEVGSGRLLNEV